MCLKSVGVQGLLEKDAGSRISSILFTNASSALGSIC